MLHPFSLPDAVTLQTELLPEKKTSVHSGLSILPHVAIFKGQALRLQITANSRLLASFSHDFFMILLVSGNDIRIAPSLPAIAANGTLF